MSILSLNTADIFNAIGGGSPLSIINSALKPSYVIRYHTIPDSVTAIGTVEGGPPAATLNNVSNIQNNAGQEALEFSGMMSIEPSGRASITTAPVEQGKYQSINKVREPNRVRCSVVVSGLTGFSGNIPNIFDFTLTTQSSTLATLKTMLATTAQYDIETPKETLEGYDLTDWSYKVTAQSGVTLLTIFLDFQEVIDQMEVQLSGSQSNTKPTSNDVASGDTGMSSITKDGSAKTSALDDLSKSWNNLKKATGQLTEQVTGTITESFQSATQTVTKTAAEVAKSATDKATTIVKSISGSIT